MLMHSSTVSLLVFCRALARRLAAEDGPRVRNNNKNAHIHSFQNIIHECSSTVHDLNIG